MTQTRDDFAPAELRLRDHLDRIRKQATLLRRLNKAELLVLAGFFEIKGASDGVSPRDWGRYGGKEELCNEIAEIMVEGS